MGWNRVVLALTGGSGAIYGVRLMERLLAAGQEIHLCISPSGAQVLRDELDLEVDIYHFQVHEFLNEVRDVLSSYGFRPQEEPFTGTLYQHAPMDWKAGIASGSFPTDAMVICPCSMSTLAAIAHGLSTNLIQRAADVHLKERRTLVLVPRESPLSAVHLENMKRCAQAGAIVLPASPGWYHRPRSLADLVDFIVARVLDHVRLPHSLGRRWGGT
jgi:4-hydroxy-3-polyprenylbenzoate decarboxylase